MHAAGVQAAGSTHQRRQAVAAAPDPLRVKDAKQFFRWFLRMKQRLLEKKGEFDTDEAYRKRLPVPFDIRKTVYFTIQRDDSPYEKEYHDRRPHQQL